MIVYLVSSIGWHDKEKPLRAFFSLPFAKQHAENLGAVTPWETAGDGHLWAWSNEGIPADTYQYAIRLLELE